MTWMSSREFSRLTICPTSLDSLYIEARYPGELGLLPDGRPTIDDARRFYEYAKWVFETVSGKL